MKYIFYLIALLLMVQPAKGQATGSITASDSDGGSSTASYHWGLMNILNKKNQTASQVELFTTPQGETFTVEVQFMDSVLVLARPQVATRTQAVIPLTESRTDLASLDCTAGFVATFVADRSGQYQMGYCASREAGELALDGRVILEWGNTSDDDGTGGFNEDSALPFVVGYPTATRSR